MCRALHGVILTVTGLVLWATVVPESDAQRRGGGGGGGGFGGGPVTREPSFRQPTVRSPPTSSSQGTSTPGRQSSSSSGPMVPRQKIPSATGAGRLPSSSNPPSGTSSTRIGQNSPVTSHPGFKNQVTTDGKPIVQVGGRNYQIPRQGIISTRLKLLSGTSPGALGVHWSPQRKALITTKLATLGKYGIAVTPNQNRETVTLGRYPSYVFNSASSGSKRFTVPTDVYKGLSEEDRWRLNRKFLDWAIRTGSIISLGSSIDRATSGSVYEREVRYLRYRGYRLAPDGKSMIKR